MKLARLEYDPASALAFYEESFSALGALCERTWHDRLEIVAEGSSATLWNDSGSIHSQELFFASADAASARDALREVFPGCPLTFRLAELLRPSPLVLEKVLLRDPAHEKTPEGPTLEKLWRSQYPATRQWRLTAEPKKCFHFSLAAVVRCDIQAIDQHWSLLRVGLSLPGGEADEALARNILLLEVDSCEDLAVPWPSLDPRRCWPLLTKVIESELGQDIEAIRTRQTQHLEREIKRIDDYFAQYKRELTERCSRTSAAAAIKMEQRLAAARAEHARRRADQAARHEIHLVPSVDALLLVAEHAWQANLEFEPQRAIQTLHATFVPRVRRWFCATP